MYTIFMITTIRQMWFWNLKQTPAWCDVWKATNIKRLHILTNPISSILLCAVNTDGRYHTTDSGGGRSKCTLSDSVPSRLRFTMRKSRVSIEITCALHETTIKKTMSIQLRKINWVHLKALNAVWADRGITYVITYTAYIIKKQLIIKKCWCLSTK